MRTNKKAKLQSRVYPAIETPASKSGVWSHDLKVEGCAPKFLKKGRTAASLGFGSAAPGKFMVFLVPQIEFQAMIKIKKS